MIRLKRNIITKNNTFMMNEELKIIDEFKNFIEVKNSNGRLMLRKDDKNYDRI